MSDVRDDIQAELGEHGEAWRKVYDAYLRDPAAVAGVASACGASGSVPLALKLRASGNDAIQEGAALNNLHRLAAALSAPVEPIVQQLKDVTDRPLFTGVPEVVKL